MGREAAAATGSLPRQLLLSFFFSLYTTWPSQSVKQDQHLRVCALRRALPLNPRGPLVGGGGAETQAAAAATAAAAAAASAAIRPTPAAALSRLGVAHFPQMTWDKATNLAAVARGGACAASGRGLIQRTYGAMGRVGEGSRGSCIEAVRKDYEGEGLEGGRERGRGGARGASTLNVQSSEQTPDTEGAVYFH